MVCFRKLDADCLLFVRDTWCSLPALEASSSRACRLHSTCSHFCEPLLHFHYSPLHGRLEGFNRFNRNYQRRPSRIFLALVGWKRGAALHFYRLEPQHISRGHTGFSLAQTQADRSILMYFFCLLSFPYICILLRYIPHAGYICMVSPLFACCPLLIERQFLRTARVVSLSVIFGIISFVQFFVARPIPFSDLRSLVLNTYVLTYTYQGIQMGLFDNLTSFASRNHLDQPQPSKSK
jgi:hypothetical protein